MACRGDQRYEVPWIGTYRWFWALWVQGTQLQSSVRAVCAPNYWASSPARPSCSFLFLEAGSHNIVQLDSKFLAMLLSQPLGLQTRATTPSLLCNQVLSKKTHSSWPSDMRYKGTHLMVSYLMCLVTWPVYFRKGKWLRSTFETPSRSKLYAQLQTLTCLGWLGSAYLVCPFALLQVIWKNRKKENTLDILSPSTSSQTQQLITTNEDTVAIRYREGNHTGKL